MSEGWAEIQPHIRSDERVLWTGRPDPSVLLSPSDAYLIPFSLLWGGFAIFWEINVIRTRAPGFSYVFGAVFVVFGLYFIFGRFVYKRRRQRKTLYALTDQRALVITGPGSVDSSPFAGQSVSMRKSHDGRHATIIFGGATSGMRNRSWPANTGMDFLNFGGGAPVAFYDVADPDPLLAALDQARA